MEQEPVYVLSDKLNMVCADVLGRIYDIRQTDKEKYVAERMAGYNEMVAQKNKYRKYLKPFGVKQYMEIHDPMVMEAVIQQEFQALKAMDQTQAQNHPMVQIHGQYSNLEHETKDCMIQCAMSETVAVSADMARGISHLGIPLDFMRRQRVGFIR